MPVPEAQKLINDLEDLLRKSPEIERQLPIKPEEPLSRDCCGQSCAPCVYDIHRVELDEWARRCWRQLNPSKIKDVETEESKESTAQPPSIFSFQPNFYQSFSLISITPMTSDTNVYRFALPSDSHRLFLPVGTHVIMKGFYEAKVSSNGSDDPVDKLLSVVRQYTPITFPGTVGYMDLMIKLYPHGKMSSYLQRLQEELEKGNTVLVEFRGPYGLFTYSSNHFSDILMLAAGTGLAPMAQIIDHILEDEDDMTRIRLLLCCRRYEDVLLKERLQEWRRHWNFSVRYVLSQWREETDRRMVKYGEELVCGSRINTLYITEEIQRLQRLETPRNGNVGASSISSAFQVLICGTKSFEKDVMNYLLKASVVAKRIFRF